jgi:replicative DNA helicase
VKPTTLAERATLGTLLVDPVQIATVQGFLRPTDFLTTWHRDVYAAMLARHQAQQPVTAKDIHADLVAAGHPDENNRGVRLVALMEVPPAHPQARRYAIMVLEASLRRQVRDLGVLLRAGAVVAAADTAGRDAAQAGPFAEIDAQLHDARRRWASAGADTTDHPASTDPNLDAAAADRIDIALKAARLVDHVTAPTSGQILRAELNVLSAVLADPTQLGAVRERITASLFTNDAHLATYAAICDLADTGDPVDAVAVCWQAQHEQVLRGKGLDADTLLELAMDPPPGDAGYHAAQMAALATRTVADQVALQLAVAAEHPGIDVNDLLDTAANHVAAVWRAIAGPVRTPSASTSRSRHLQLVDMPRASPRTAGRTL